MSHRLGAHGLRGLNVGGGRGLGALGAVHDLRIVFHGVDRVSHVADTIASKVRGLGGAIAILGGSGLLVTNLAEQFGILNKHQAVTLDKTFALIAATGSLISIFARLIPVLQGLAAVQSIANAARAVALALSGPIGWAILGGAAIALAAFGIYELSQASGGTSPPASMRDRQGPMRGQFGLDAIVSRPTMFLAGEAGAERVTITPQGRPGGGAGGFVANINIYGSGDPQSIARAVKRELEVLIDRERIRRS
jgi:hypothetical protein